MSTTQEDTTLEIILDPSVTFLKLLETCIDLPFLIFHFSFIIFMFKMRAKKKSEYLKSFMTILLITAVIDAIAFVIMFFCLYLVDEGWFYSIYIYSPFKDVIARTGWVVSELQYNFDMITHSILSLNRFSAVYFPTKYEKWWSIKFAKIIIAAQLILPVFICSFAIYIHGSSGTVLLNPDGTDGYDVSDPNIFIVTFLVDAVVTGICASISLFCNIMTGVKYRSITKNWSSEQKMRGGLDMRLYFHSIVMLLFQVVLLAYNLVCAIAMLDNDQWLLSFATTKYRWLIDVMIFGNSLSLILLSKKIRIDYAKFIGLKFMLSDANKATPVFQYVRSQVHSHHDDSRITAHQNHA